MIVFNYAEPKTDSEVFNNTRIKHVFLSKKLNLTPAALKARLLTAVICPLDIHLYLSKPLFLCGLSLEESGSSHFSF